MYSYMEMIYLLCLLVTIKNEISELFIIKRLCFIHFNIYKMQTFKFKTERLLKTAKIIILTFIDNNYFVMVTTYLRCILAI